MDEKPIDHKFYYIWAFLIAFLIIDLMFAYEIGAFRDTEKEKVCYEYITENGEIITVGFLQALTEFGDEIDKTLSISADYNTSESKAEVRIARYTEEDMESDKSVITPYETKTLDLRCYRWVYVENAI